MREAYRGYIRVSAEDLELIWKDALVVPDANILLNLYRYSEKTRTELLKLLRDLRDRIWLPNQAGLEFHRNRLGLILDEAAKYEAMLKSFTRLLEELDETRGHPFVSVKLRKALGLVHKQLEKEVKLSKEQFEKLLHEDPVLDEVVKLFSGRVGDGMSNEEVAAIRKEGEDRYKRRIPPGFMDEKKPEETKYGDLILWKQILKKTEAEKRPVILVSDDRKEDWWWQVRGRTIGPHPALREEFFAACGKPFHMYSSDQFMQHAGGFLQRRVEPKAIDEAKKTREQLDVRRRWEEEVARAVASQGQFPSMAELHADAVKRLDPLASLRRELLTRDAALAAAMRAPELALAGLGRELAARDAALAAAMRAPDLGDLAGLGRELAARDAALRQLFMSGASAPTPPSEVPKDKEGQAGDAGEAGKE